MAAVGASIDSTVPSGHSSTTVATESSSPATAAIYVVLHYLSHPSESKRDALLFEQVEIATRANVDGIFLISHSGLDASLPPLARRIKQQHPKLRIGINLLSRMLMDAAKIAVAHQLDMVWGDHCGISSKGIDDDGRKFVAWLKEYRAGTITTSEPTAAPKAAVPTVTASESSLSSAFLTPAEPQLPLLVFGSVAFKGQRPIETDAGASVAAELALHSGFIPTTSGPMTGIPPKLSKIRMMSRATSGCLAIASGITTRNVCQFAPLLSQILVSTGVSKNEWELDPVKLSTLVQLVRTRATQRPPDYPGEVISEEEDP